MSDIRQAENLRKSMHKTFEGEHAKRVLVHLADFCGATHSNFRSEALDMARMEGRREVWLQIQSNLNLTENDLITMARAIGDDYD